MDVKYINPFINSLANTTETMLGISPERKIPYIKNDDKAAGDVTGIIGFASPEVEGSIALTFPTRTALIVHEMMMGEKLGALNEEVQDTVGELANLIAGGAKDEFAKLGIGYRISIPTVVAGKGHTISHKGGIPVLVIPFILHSFTFYMEVSMKVKSMVETVIEVEEEATA